eukprot:TRINITY_DN9416_c0_g1_i1.p1 TRINITY_DN9416_c0_g1~~TRINITY_DN9416_c0_g1_i1.p1  ORF type:complete len:132 (+),score=27.17 TRINITY_DN9416_c0_g1_i1:105-500(+)
MLLFLLTTPSDYDVKPTKMANFLASFGRQRDFRFPIQKLKNLDDTVEAAWAIVALSLRESVTDVEAQFKVITSTEGEPDQQVLVHEFKTCCDVFVEKQLASVSELIGNKTVRFSVCGQGPVSVAIHFGFGV